MPRFPCAAPHTASFSDRVYSTLSARAQRAAGEDEVAPLHIGDTYLEPPPAFRAEMAARARSARNVRYAPVQGLPELLEAIRAKLQRHRGLNVPVERLQVMSGATAGLGVVCQALLSPGDELILPTPTWPLARGLATARAATTIEVPFFTRVGDADFDPEATLEAAVTDRSVAIYLNTPHNPTGVVLEEDIVAAIARVAKRHDLWVLADEAYEDLYYGDAPPPVWAREDLKARVIVSHTLSKSYAIAGARIGFTHGPEEIMGRVRGLQTFMTYCAPTPLQFAAARALDEGDPFLAECRARYREAARLAAEALGVEMPAGGTFVFADVSGLLGPDDVDATPILEACADVGVLVTPGLATGDDYARAIRLCYTAVEPARLSRALERIAPIFASD